MAREKKKSIKPSPELIASLKSLAKGTGKEFDTVTAEFSAIVKEDFLADFDAESRLDMAYRILRARYAEQYIGEAKTYQFIVLDVAHPRGIAVKEEGKKTGKKQLFAQIFGVFLEVDAEDEEPEYGEVDLYRDAAKVVTKLELHKAYQAQFTGNKKKGVYSLGAGGDKVPEISQLDEMPIKDFNAWDWLLDRFDGKVEIITAQDNVSANPADKKVIIGQVAGSFAGKGRSGYPFGRYNLIDDSMDLEDIKKTGGLSCMVAHNQIRWAVGSEIMIVGSLQSDDQYGMTHNGEVIIDKFGIPKPKINIDDYGAGEAKQSPEESPAPEEEPEPEEPEEGAEDGIDLSGLS